MTLPRRKRTYRIVPAAPVARRRERPSRTAPRSQDELALALYGRPRQVLISEAAYYRALGRRFGEGDSIADWLAAENEIDALLREGAPPLDGDATPAARPQPGSSLNAARSQT